MSASKILVVDDEEVIRESLAEWLAEAGYDVATAPDGASALELIQAGDVDVVLADLKMPGMDGIELMKKAKELDPTLPFIIMTAYGSIASAVEATKAGAADYLEKPFCPESVEVHLQNLLRHRALLKENVALKRELARRFRFEELVGKSHGMEQVFDLVRTVAKTHATVLIQGETGTGKELVARAIHAQSLRAKGPFVSLNCAALPESLLESELFGHEKGAFTGAASQKKGKFEFAHTGTILLDEIGDISPNVQLHLLRVLQEREFSRVGGNEIIKVDVRIIASTNRDLAKRIADGLFREDLFYRLNVVTIHVPPLRERTEDIVLLARYFLKKACTENGKAVPDFSPETLERLMKYEWPGNVRELENAVEHAVIVAQGELIQIENLPASLNKAVCGSPEAPDDAAKTLEEAEKLHILRILQENDWNLTHAASMLGISRSTLHLKLKAYDISKH